MLTDQTIYIIFTMGSCQKSPSRMPSSNQVTQGIMRWEPFFLGYSNIRMPLDKLNLSYYHVTQLEVLGICS